MMENWYRLVADGSADCSVSDIWSVALTEENIGCHFWFVLMVFKAALIDILTLTMGQGQGEMCHHFFSFDIH